MRRPRGYRFVAQDLAPLLLDQRPPRLSKVATLVTLGLEPNDFFLSILTIKSISECQKQLAPTEGMRLNG